MPCDHAGIGIPAPVSTSPGRVPATPALATVIDAGMPLIGALAASRALEAGTAIHLATPAAGGSLAARPPAEEAVLYKIAAAGAAVTAVPLVIVLLAASIMAAAQPGDDTGLGGKPTPLARQDIPADYLAWYSAAARTCPGLPWSVPRGHRRGREQPRPVHAARRPHRRQQRRRRRTHAVPARHLRQVRRQRRPRPSADSLRSPGRDLHRSQDAVRQRRPRRHRAPASGRRSLPTTTPPGTSPTSSPGRSGTPRQQQPAAAPLPSPSPRRSSASPTAGAARAPAASTAAASSSPPTPPRGIHLARTTFGWQQDGPQVPLSQLQPGDLLFSAGSDGTPASPGHVVMYLGSGQVIQAPMTGENVQIDPIDLATIVVATRPADLPTSP